MALNLFGKLKNFITDLFVENTQTPNTTQPIDLVEDLIEEFTTPKDTTEYIDLDTGEITKGKINANSITLQDYYNLPKYRQEEYQRFPNDSEIIIQNFRSDVISRFPEIAGPILNRWLNDVINSTDEDSVAHMLQESADNGIIITYKIAYDKDLVMGAIADMMDFLDLGQGYKEDILDILEENEDWDEPM